MALPKMGTMTRYNDGVVLIYREKQRQTSFNAKKNVSSLDDMEFVAKLDYMQTSTRAQDLEWAEQAGYSIDIRIRTRLMPGIDTKCKCVIGPALYNVRNIDRMSGEMYLTLEKERDLNA